ncbi:MAG: DUF58 domain-containing protein [Chloroflexi bacterium]|nr:DUF58 domain-containing protein [Chloroflexota bacterium]
MIRRRGVGLLVVAVIGFFVASATRVGWLHLATALLAGALILSAVFPQLSLFRLKAEARFVPRRQRPDDLVPITGEKVDIEISVKNGSIAPRFFVAATPMTTMDPALPRGSPRAGVLFAHVRGKATATCGLETVANARGLHRIRQVTLECRAPFGLFRARRRRQAEGEVLVYPAWFPLRETRLLDAVHGDMSGRRPARRGDEIATSRRYIAGDALRDIHWKNTARTGRPMVREFDAGIEETVTIVFETGSTLGSGAESTLEYAITLAASVSGAVIARGGAVQIATGREIGEPIYDWSEVMRMLAVVEPSGEVTMVAALNRAQLAGRIFAVVSGAHHAQMLALLSAARRGLGVACVVLEGFAPGDSAGEAVRELGRAGCAAVPCVRGRLPAAAAAIERGAVAGAVRAAASERIA